jgi:hypothetical protein
MPAGFFMANEEFLHIYNPSPLRLESMDKLGMWYRDKRDILTAAND